MQKIRISRPHIHGYHRIRCDPFADFRIIALDFSIHYLNSRCLNHFLQISIFICHTDTSSYSSVLTQRVLQRKSSHGKVHLLFILILGTQEIMKLYKCFFSIIIICINNHKWLFDHTLASQNCLSSSPWFHAPCRDFISIRQVFQFLIDILYWHNFR